MPGTEPIYWDERRFASKATPVGQFLLNLLSLPKFPVFEFCHVLSLTETPTRTRQKMKIINTQHCDDIRINSCTKDVGRGSAIYNISKWLIKIPSSL